MKTGHVIGVIHPPTFNCYLSISKIMGATPRYKINDQVNKKRNTGVFLTIGGSIGTVVSLKVKTNKKGTPGYYCTVKWPDGRTSEHAQHMLVPAP